MGGEVRTVVWLVVLTAVVLLRGVSVALAATEKPLVTVKFSHAGTACQSTLNSKGGPTYNLPSGESETGIAFDGAGNLYVSCWGDPTIDEINLATRVQTIFTVSGGSGFGALTFHAGTLWACNQHTVDVGTISLDPSTDSGVFTHAFTASGSGCTDALAFDPLDPMGQTMWMGTDVGTTPKATGETLDEFVAGAYLQSISVATSIGHRSGIVATRPRPCSLSQSRTRPPRSPSTRARTAHSQASPSSRPGQGRAPAPKTSNATPSHSHPKRQSG